jgi:hypothetical protein
VGAICEQKSRRTMYPQARGAPVRRFYAFNRSNRNRPESCVEALVPGGNLVYAIDDDHVQWDIFSLHELEPQLFLECDKDIG